MTVTESATHPNGVDIEAIRAARTDLTDAPELAAFQFRATNRWVDGVHSRTTFDTFYGVGAEQAHRRPFTYDADHPELFAAPDNGPTPVEFVLHGLAACITAGIASIAANRGITLRSVTSTLEGDLDMRGLMGIDDDVRNGYQSVRVSFEIDGDAPADELEKLVHQSIKRSAVFDVVSNGVPVTVDVSS
ncbi:MAG TPA: OsmC family protein [Acidimicrobiia bacterium]